MFSAKAVLIKLAYRHDINSISLMSLRMGFSLPVFLVINFYTSLKHKKNPIAKKMYVKIIILAMLGYYLATYFDFYGLKYITASLERLILFVYPTLVVIIGMVLYGRKITKVQTIAILLTYIGIITLVLEDLEITSEDQLFTGSILIFLSALTYAFYLVGIGEIIPMLGAVRFTALAMSISCVCVLIHFSLTNELISLFQYDAEIYWIGLIMALFCTILPSFMISKGVGMIGASKTAIIGGIGPVSTLFLAYVFLEERLTLLQLIGTMVVISAVITITLEKQRITKPIN